MAERFRFLPDQAKAIRVAAVDVTKVTGVRSAVREPGPTSTTVPWKFAGMRMPAFATLEYVVSKIVSPTVLTPDHCAGSRTSTQQSGAVIGFDATIARSAPTWNPA